MSDPSFWNQDWMRLQQQYWENWTEMSRRAMGGGKPATPPWESAMAHWWEAVAPALQGIPGEFMEKLMQQGAGFLQMNQEIASQLEQGQDWMTAIDGLMADLRKRFEEGSGSIAAPWGGSGRDGAGDPLMAFWEIPVAHWQKMADAWLGMPGAAPGGLPFQDQLSQVLGMPGLGHTREQEEQYRELIQSALDYQRALGEYTRFFSGTGLEAVAQMQQRLRELEERGDRPTGARELYDLWVGCCEEVYARRVMIPEYAEIHGRLVNALMDLKQRLGRLMDRHLSSFGMPTRRELHTLQDRMQETRRENRALRSEMEQLKQQLAALQASAGPAPARRPARRKTAKKTVKKKVTTKPGSNG